MTAQLLLLLCFSHDYRQLYVGGFTIATRVLDTQPGIISTVSAIGGSRAQAVDSKGAIFTPSRLGLRMRSPDGGITLLEDATAQPPLRGVKHLWADRDDNVLIANVGNHLIRKFMVADRKLITLRARESKEQPVSPVRHYRRNLVSHTASSRIRARATSTSPTRAITAWRGSRAAHAKATEPTSP